MPDPDFIVEFWSRWMWQTAPQPKQLKKLYKHKRLWECEIQ